MELFVEMLVDAADRGVEVRLLMDGIANRIRVQPDMYETLTTHPNIKLALYEPFNFMKPWTWQNRMHDKMIIVDGEVAMTGGRNIGDKYFTDDVPSLSIDRDVMVFRGESQKDTDLIMQMSQYYNELWENDLTVLQSKETSESDRDSDSGQTISHGDPSLSHWYAKSHPIHGATYVTNPIGRFYKEGVVWEHMLELTNHAEESVLVQTPYIVPTSQMQEDMDAYGISDENVEANLLTNSLASSNNVIANSGYQNNRQAILENNTTIYEFLPPDAQFHTKAFIIDDAISAVGTFNFDSRSAYLNTESMLIVDSPAFTQELLANLQTTYGSQIDEVSLENPEDESDYSSGKRFVSTVLRPVARLFAPFL